VKIGRIGVIRELLASACQHLNALPLHQGFFRRIPAASWAIASLALAVNAGLVYRLTDLSGERSEFRARQRY
jgi:hypothetical protein